MNQIRLRAYLCTITAFFIGTLTVCAQPASPDANKRAVLRFLEEVWNKGDVALCDSLISADAIGHYSGSTFPSGPARAREIVTRWRSAFEGFHFRIESIFAEGNMVAAHIPFEGVHSMTFFGIPATGRNIDIDEIFICRVEDGKIAEFWGSYDEWGLRTTVAAAANRSPGQGK